MIEFDVESTGLQPWSGEQVAFSMQFWQSGTPRESGEFLVVGTAGHYERDEADVARVQRWLDRGKVEGIRAHNATFDRAFGEVTLPELDWPGDGCWHDSLIVAQTINERRSNALKALGDSLLGDGASDLQKDVKAYLNKLRAERKKAATAAGEELVEPTFADVPRDIMEPYGMEDVFLQGAISEQFDHVLEQQPKLAGVVEFERKVMDALYAVQKHGLPADREGYHKLRVEVSQNLERLHDIPLKLALEGDPDIFAAEASGHKLGEFNPNSSANIIAALKARGANLDFMEKDGGKIKSADREQLEAVDDELATAILNFRSEYKVLSTYVNAYVDRHYDSGLRAWKEPFISNHDDRIHANYRQVGARTGRMSCSDPNMQNQPRDDLRLRYNIRAEPGHKLVCCDLSNIEMRIFAAYAGNGRLLEAVRRGEDLHTLTARFIGIKDRVRAGGFIETARQRGKTFNFSVVYGGGLRTIRRQQRVDTATARLMRNRYYDAYPEVKKLQNRIEYRLWDQGYIEDLWGRRYRVDSPQQAKAESYKFTNYLVQGTASEVFKEALIALHADGVPVVALVHDEIMAHVPEADAVEAQALIIKRLTQSTEAGGKLHVNGQAVVPLDADGDIVDRWSDAKPLKDKDGRAYLFTPRWAGGEKRYVVQ